jgi:hypothetical protein
MPPLRQGETVIFEPGKVVDTDLDFGPWVEDGTLVRMRENHEPPRPPKPTPVPVVAPEILTPMPSFVRVETVKEEAPAEVTEEMVETDPPATPEDSRRRRRVVR